MNAREGIKTDRDYASSWCRTQLKTMNAREGIKTDWIRVAWQQGTVS